MGDNTKQLQQQQKKKTNTTGVRKTKNNGVRIPIVHYSLFVKDDAIRKELGQTWLLQDERLRQCGIDNTWPLALPLMAAADGPSLLTVYKPRYGDVVVDTIMTTSSPSPSSPPSYVPAEIIC